LTHHSRAAKQQADSDYTLAQAADTISVTDDSKQQVTHTPYGAGLAAHVLAPTPVLHLHPSPVLAPPTSLLHLHDTIPASAIREFLERN